MKIQLPTQLRMLRKIRKPILPPARQHKNKKIYNRKKSYA